MRLRLLLLVVAIAALPPVALRGDLDEGRRLIAERLPRIVYRGGRFLRFAVITTVTFAGDEPSIVPLLESFGAMIGGSAWWHAVTEGYCVGAECVGAGRAAPPVRLPRRLPSRLRDVDVDALIAGEAAGGALGRLDENALLLVYLPPGVALSDAFNPQYCGGGPRAYHRALRVESRLLAYAVIPRCGDEGETTATASHEILEAVTNPDPDRPAFRLPAGSSAIAFTAAGAEPVDPCGLLNADRHRAIESGFLVQRAWSNRAASEGTDPCAPSVPERPYVALIPRTPVVRLAPDGATTSIVLDAVSDRPVPAWNVEAIDLTGGGEPAVDAQLNTARVSSGNVATLTLRAIRPPPRQTAIVGLVSRLGSHAHVWPLAINLRAD
jgi:hypothetical protein